MQTGSIGRKAVLVSLAVMADTNTGRCEARQDTIAQQVEAEERTVRRHLRDLEAAGLIARRHQYRADGRRRNDEFLLLAPEVEAWPDGGPLPDRPSGSSGQRDSTTGQKRPSLPDKNDRHYRTRMHPHERPQKNNHKGTKPPNPPDAEFSEWLRHHIEVTGNKAMSRPGTKAYAQVEAAWRERRREYPDDDLRLVSVGAMADEHRRANGYTDPESVLRPKAVPKLLERGRGARSEYEWDGKAILDRARQEVEGAR